MISAATSTAAFEACPAAAALPVSGNSTPILTVPAANACGEIASDAAAASAATQVETFLIIPLPFRFVGTGSPVLLALELTPAVRLRHPSQNA